MGAINRTQSNFVCFVLKDIGHRFRAPGFLGDLRLSFNRFVVLRRSSEFFRVLEGSSDILGVSPSSALLWRVFPSFHEFFGGLLMSLCHLGFNGAPRHYSYSLGVLRSGCLYILGCLNYANSPTRLSQSAPFYGNAEPAWQSRREMKNFDEVR